MSYKSLNTTFVLEHLEQGQIIEIEEYIEKLKFFSKYGRIGIDGIFKSKGAYIIEKCYIPGTEKGLHFYNYETLIKHFEKFRCVNRFRKAKKQFVRIDFTKDHILNCEKVVNP